MHSTCVLTYDISHFIYTKKWFRHETILTQKNIILSLTHMAFAHICPFNLQLNSKIKDTLQETIEEEYRGLDKTDSYSVAWNYFMLKVSAGQTKISLRFNGA